MPQVVDPDTGESTPRPARSGLSPWVRRVGLFVLSLVCARIIFDLVGAIDWEAVRAGVAHLRAWQFALMVGVVVVRQVLNSMPLAYFIDGLSVVRATGCDQGSSLISMIAPPTSDKVFRVVVLRSWGVELDRAAAGSTCSIVMFNLARWVSPLLGVLLLIGVRFDAIYTAAAAVGVLLTAAILVGALLVTKSQALAARFGRRFGRLASRVRGSIDPDRWAALAVDFQSHVADRFRSGLALTLLILVGKLFVDATLVLLAIRFVGVGRDELPTVEVLAAFLVVFPLTLFPLQGLGILDATLVAALTAVGGVELEADLVAALLTYRVVALGTPAALGAVFVLGWRRSTRRQRRGNPI
jgi:uncharacterized membrane protein YbhN (UPF0104 family)